MDQRFHIACHGTIRVIVDQELHSIGAHASGFFHTKAWHHLAGPGSRFAGVTAGFDRAEQADGAGQHAAGDRLGRTI